MSEVLVKIPDKWVLKLRELARFRHQGKRMAKIAPGHHQSSVHLTDEKRDFIGIRGEWAVAWYFGGYLHQFLDPLVGDKTNPGDVWLPRQRKWIEVKATTRREYALYTPYDANHFAADYAVLCWPSEDGMDDEVCIKGFVSKNTYSQKCHDLTFAGVTYQGMNHWELDHIYALKQHLDTLNIVKYVSAKQGD